MLIAAASAAALVLLLHGRARADTAVGVEQAERWLTDRTPLAADERLEAAEGVLRRSSRRRLREVHSSALETTTRVWTGGSPYGVAKSSYRLARRLFGLRERSAAEDAALDWLEPAIRREIASPELRRKYDALHARELRWLAGRKFLAARDALGEGENELARLRLRRSLELWPGDPRAQLLLEDLGKAAPERGFDPLLDLRITTSTDELAVAAALLREDGEAARALMPATRSGSLARGVLEYLDGDQERALERFERLSEGDDATAELARRWLSDPDVNLGAAFRRERRSYRTRRALGFVGGAALANDGLELSTDSYRAWRNSLRPLNLALSFPSRMFTGFEPEDRGLRGAAEAYLDARPGGPLALEAEDWLSRLGPDRTLSLFTDGALELPAATTPYDTLLAEPVVVTRRVLDHALFERGDVLAGALGDARAIVLLPKHGGQDLRALRGDAALAVLGELSRGLERGELSARGRSGFAALEALRRLENAVRDGAALRARAFAPEGPELGLRRTVLDGGNSRAAGGVDVARDGDELQLSKDLASEGFRCPEQTLCIDRDAVLDAALFGKIEADSDARIGLEGRAFDSRLSLEVSMDRAEAEIVLPLTEWLGVERWLPFDTRFGIGTEGISVLPRLRHPDDEEARSWELGIRKEF
jgi:hypothetical protein